MDILTSAVGNYHWLHRDFDKNKIRAKLIVYSSFFFSFVCVDSLNTFRKLSKFFDFSQLLTFTRLFSQYSRSHVIDIITDFKCFKASSNRTTPWRHSPRSSIRSSIINSFFAPCMCQFCRCLDNSRPRDFFSFTSQLLLIQSQIHFFASTFSCSFSLEYPLTFSVTRW